MVIYICILVFEQKYSVLRSKHTTSVNVGCMKILTKKLITTKQVYGGANMYIKSAQKILNYADSHNTESSVSLISRDHLNCCVYLRILIKGSVISMLAQSYRQKAVEMIRLIP